MPSLRILQTLLKNNTKNLHRVKWQVQYSTIMKTFSVNKM